MNILIVGSCAENLYKLIKESTMYSKLYVTVTNLEVDLPSIEYNDFEELAYKAKKLQIDLVLVTEKEYIENGLVDFLKSKFVNVISPNKKWFNLEASRTVAKQLLNHYSINTSKIILAPRDFPVVIRTDSSKVNKIANSMDELVLLMNGIAGDKYFLEEYLEGNCQKLLCLWDGACVYHFEPLLDLTEVQKDRLDLLKTKINFMMADETPDFIGFFSIKIIWSKNEWYILDFKMSFEEKIIVERVKEDFLYLLNATLYQKLNELK